MKLKLSRIIPINRFSKMYWHTTLTDMNMKKVNDFGRPQSDTDDVKGPPFQAFQPGTFSSSKDRVHSGQCTAQSLSIVIAGHDLKNSVEGMRIIVKSRSSSYAKSELGHTIQLNQHDGHDRVSQKQQYTDVDELRHRGYENLKDYADCSEHDHKAQNAHEAKCFRKFGDHRTLRYHAQQRTNGNTGIEPLPFVVDKSSRSETNESYEDLHKQHAIENGILQFNNFMVVWRRGFTVRSAQCM